MFDVRNLSDLRESLLLWRRKHAYRQRELDLAHEFNRKDAIAKWERLRREAANMIARRLEQIEDIEPDITTTGGARGIVDQAFAVARHVGGPKLYIGSGYRPGAATTSGNVSDHARNDTYQAARDIGKQGRDLLWGPPSKELDYACVAIGKAFGRDYRLGTTVIDTFHWKGYRLQCIWRTALFGGHLGHIHCGAKRD